MLAQCEFTMEKSVQVHAMNLSEQESYEKLTKDIGKFSSWSSGSVKQVNLGVRFVLGGETKKRKTVFLK